MPARDMSKRNAENWYARDAADASAELGANVNGNGFGARRDADGFGGASKNFC